MISVAFYKFGFVLVFSCFALSVCVFIVKRFVCKDSATAQTDVRLRGGVSSKFFCVCTGLTPTVCLFFSPPPVLQFKDPVG